MKRLITILIAAGLVAAGCAHKKVTYEGGGFGSNEKQGAGLQAQVMWLKSKTNSIDIFLSLTNKYEQPILFKRSGISLTLDGQPMNLKKSNFSGEMAPNGFEKELMIFETPDRKEGSGGVAVLKIDNIYLDSGKSAKEDKKVPPLVLELEVKKE
ncbi:MAG: hypothetical protein ABL958_04805 [Bdellovibrionia bacterium]